MHPGCKKTATQTTALPQGITFYTTPLEAVPEKCGKVASVHRLLQNPVAQVLELKEKIISEAIASASLAGKRELLYYNVDTTGNNHKNLNTRFRTNWQMGASPNSEGEQLFGKT